MIFHAIVLAGGRATRLGGIDKTALAVDGRTLLARVVAATRGAASVTVVGAAPPSPDYTVVREDPPFGGPAAALAAGLDALDAGADDLVLVLAGDLPHVAGAVETLLTRARRESDRMADALIAVDADGRLQYLTSLARVSALRRAVAEIAPGDSMRRVFASLSVATVAVPEGSTQDVDTWIDAASLGIELVANVARDPRVAHDPGVTKGSDPMTADSTSPYPELDVWNARLSDALDIPPADVAAMLDLAGVAAHRVIRPAAPVTTFLVGYAAGRLVAAGAAPDEAVRRATEVAEALLAEDSSSSATHPA